MCILLLTFISQSIFFINYLIIFNTHITKNNKFDIHNTLNILLHIKYLFNNIIESIKLRFSFDSNVYFEFSIL